MVISFERWMKKVDELLSGIAYVTSGDLPDYMYRDAYDDGATPKSVVENVLEENGLEYMLP